MHVGRRRGAGLKPEEMTGLSTSVVRRAVETGETVATGNAVADPSLGQAQSVMLLDLRTIVCIPLRSPRADEVESAAPHAVGAIYVDNQETSAPFSADSLKTVEALARHAALAIENALLFERERKRIEELRTAQKQLLQSEKLATIGQMAAGIAHELNTPLTYIMGNLELLEAQPASNAQKEMLASIARGRGADHAASPSACSPSAAPPRRTPSSSRSTTSSSAAWSCATTRSSRAGCSSGRSWRRPCPTSRACPTSSRWPSSTWWSTPYMPWRAGAPCTSSTSARDGGVEISVADTGQGIPLDIQPTIFEPFFTTKPEGKGTGLGLSTVLMIVERHKGRIDFTSAPGAGTTFRISLPSLPVAHRLPLDSRPEWRACGCAARNRDSRTSGCAGLDRGFASRIWHAACLRSARGNRVLTRQRRD